MFNVNVKCPRDSSSTLIWESDAASCQITKSDERSDLGLYPKKTELEH